MFLIELQRIEKSYPLGKRGVLPILRGVSLVVNEGEMVALMGPSGSGKSTLLNIIGCLDRSTKGSYLLEGNDMTRERNRGLELARRTKIGFVFQDFNLLPRLSAVRNVELPLIYQGLSRRERGRRALEMLRELGLEARSTHRPPELSGGEKQRVAIARALVSHPKLLLTDEPTGNLDSKTSKEVMELFRQLHETKHLTVLLVTHDPDIAAYADRTVRLSDGQIVAG